MLEKLYTIFENEGFISETKEDNILPQKSRQFKKKSNSLQNSQPQALILRDFS